MDLFGAHMRQVLRNQIQREPLQVKMSQNTGPSPLLRDTGGFTLPPTNNAWSLPSTGAWSLRDGGYSSESKQVKENLTGGLTEAPDKHAHTPESDEQVGDEEGEDSGNAATPVRTAAERSATRVAGSSRSVGGGDEFTSIQKAAARAARRVTGDERSPAQEAAARAASRVTGDVRSSAQKAAKAAGTRVPEGALHNSGVLFDLVKQKPGSKWRPSQQPAYLLHRANAGVIYHVPNKKTLEKAFGGRSRYEKLYDEGLGRRHAYGQVRRLSNGDGVAAYHRGDIKTLLERNQVVEMPRSAMKRSLTKAVARRRKKSTEGAAMADQIGLPAARSSPVRNLDQAFSAQ